ncbi:MAG: hypothetical protein WAO00_08890 [Chthoniobacterales bacterium]
METADRFALAQKRLRSVLSSHTVATARTLEQKISDAGPFDQRIDPHVLSEAREDLRQRGVVNRIARGQVPWYHLADALDAEVEARLIEQEAIHGQMLEKQFVKRCGQTLEIAVFKALQGQGTPFFGSYPDLDAHDDGSLYSKEEPPSSLSGRAIPRGKKLDFLLLHPESGPVGIEVKNTRVWLYPHSHEIREFIFKCCCLDAVPLMVARRIAYVTFSLLNPCGFIFHQTYNQLFPNADATLAAAARHKKLLGYHDIRLGNDPDARMRNFFENSLPKITNDARIRFDKMKDLLCDYGSNQIQYPAFAAKVRERCGRGIA